MINGSLSVAGSISGRLARASVTTAEITAPRVVPPRAYEGICEVTPGQEAVTLATAGLVMLQDITVNPVPQEYGRIAWDGSRLTVS